MSVYYLLFCASQPLCHRSPLPGALNMPVETALISRASLGLNYGSLVWILLESRGFQRVPTHFVD